MFKGLLGSKHGQVDKPWGVCGRIERQLGVGLHQPSDQRGGGGEGAGEVACYVCYARLVGKEVAPCCEEVGTERRYCSKASDHNTAWKVCHNFIN